MAAKTNGSKATAAPHGGKRKGMTKAEALRQTVRTLGKDAKPLELQAHIKKHFGLEMSTDHISASKTAIIRKMGGGAPKAPSVKPFAAPKPALQRTAKAETRGPAVSNGKTVGRVSMSDIEVAKGLVARVGAHQLVSLIDLLAK